jgi:two-component system, cell cycle sensor histidine kinase and response regulator CckA
LGIRTQPTRADFFNAIEFTWKRKDGKPVYVRASGRRISQADTGDLIEIIAEDVTARRSLEEQLRHSQKMEALGQLSGSVAHDFNNLLSVIIGYSELVLLDPALEPSIKANLATIKSAGERAASLTAQLLAFSRRQVMQPSVVNLNSLVRETEKMMQRLVREDVALETILDPSLWKIRADSGQLVQVIMNLAINARDAMPKGGTVTLKTANATFADSVSFGVTEIAPGQYVMLSVRDTGIGMDRQTLTKIFEPFFTTKANGKGTGLGLATVFGIIKQSGGYIFADSQPGQGSTFSIYLPRLEQPIDSPSAVPAAIEQRKGAYGSETLLVVEDEGAFRNLLRDGLRSKGYDVLVASNGVDALRVAEDFQGEICLLVTDMIMPHMSGPELASALRKSRPDVAVLYMSGYTDDEVRDEPISSEVTLMQKPFYVDQIAGRIREIIARKNTTTSNPGVSAQQSL